MPTTQELREKRANIWNQMTAIMDRSADGMSAEDATAYDKAEADLDAIESEIGRRDRHAARETSNEVDRSELRAAPMPGTEGEVSQEAYAKAFVHWMANGTVDMDPEQRKVLQAGRVDSKDIKAAQGIGTGGAGGYTVPPAFRDVIVEKMKQVTSVRPLVETITTATGANLQWPTVDDTANVGAILAENTAVTQQDATFSTASIDAYMYTSKLTLVSLQLLQDTFFDLEAWLRKTQATRIGRIQNQHFTTGTGTSQPDGLVTGAVAGVTGATGSTTSVTFDNLIDLVDVLDPAYLDGNERFMFHQKVRPALRKIKDNQNRYIWQPAVSAGEPDTILGYPYTINNDMPQMAANAKSILFGDFGEAYVIRDVRDFFLVRFGERYMDSLQVGFAGFMRTDGTVQNTAAYTAYQNSAT